jgi:ABC-type multidrug transport system ATPase subunit
LKITLTNAGKRFNREWIFHNLNYEFIPDIKYAITGPNGSGKSTLLQVVCSNLILNEGNCEWQLENRNLPQENVHLHVSIAAPYLELIEEMTAKEFLNFHNQFKNFIADFSVDDILKEAGLYNAADKQIRFFSSGMKQRLKLVQAIFSDVPVVLLDEPCTNLDASGFELYYKWIEQYCNNRLLIISSNDKNEYSVCEREINILQYKKTKPTVHS